MQFPCLVYKVPGPHRGNYRYTGCPDAEAWEALKAQGWHASKEEARGKVQADAVIEAAEALEARIDDISPPTRAELETKAEELGIGFNKRTRDEVLAKRIADAV